MENQNTQEQAQSVAFSNPVSEESPMQKILIEIERENELQRNYLKKQLFYTRIFAVSMFLVALVVIGSVLILLPKVNETISYANETMINMNQTMEELTVVFQSVNELVTSNEASVGQAIEKLNAVDIESLNSAIGDLNAVVEPMAKFFDKFK